MLRKSRIWLVLAGLAATTVPAFAQEEVILTIPERRPAPPAAQPPEAPPPVPRPDPGLAAGNIIPPPEAPTASPSRPLQPPAPEPEALEAAAPDAATTEPEAGEPETATGAAEPATEGEAADSETGTTDMAETETAGPPPLPLRKPAPGDRPTVAWKNAKVIAAREACDTLLKDRNIDYERLQPIRRGACGAPAPILVKSLGADLPVAIEPPATVQCPLAAALDTWLNEQVQPAALSTFGSPVVKIRNISSYKCRNRYNAKNTKISEHAFANALDISEFELASGKKITVLRGWPRLVKAPAPPPPPEPNPDRAVTPGIELTPVKSDPDAAFTPSPPEASPSLDPEPRDRSEFLRAIHADGCKTFNTMLGPNANAAHANHFHVDMKIRRYVKICE